MKLIIEDSETPEHKYADIAEIRDFPDENGNHLLTVTFKNEKCICYGNIIHTDYVKMMTFYQGGEEALFWVYADILNALITAKWTVNTPFSFTSEFGTHNKKVLVFVQLHELKKLKD